MKSYTLTQISGADFTVSLNGTPLTVTEFENVFYSAGEAQLISGADASGFTIWDSDQKDGNSISSTAEIISATPYNATWDEIESGATSNVFTSIKEADGIGLTKFQLSELMGKIKEAGGVKTLRMSELSEGQGKRYIPYELNGLYAVVNDLGNSQTLYVASVRTPAEDYCINFQRIDAGDEEYVLLDKYIALAFKGHAGGVTVFQNSILFGNRAQSGDANYAIKSNLVIDNLTSTQTKWVLSANQGRVLKDLIDSLVIKNTGAPTTSTVGTVGKLYEDTTNGKLYICTDATNPYAWEEVGGGGGGGLADTTTFWGQTASGGAVSGNIALGNASTDHPKTVGLTSNNAKIEFGHDSPDNGFDYTRVKATNTTTNKSATLEVMAHDEAYISSDAPLYMGSKQIKNLADGTANTDAVNKGQLDTAISGIGGVKKAGSSAWEPTVLQYINENSGVSGALFDAGLDMSDEPFYVGIGASGDDTPADGYGPRPYMLSGSVNSSGKKLTTLKKRIPLFSEMEDRILAGGTTAPTTATVGKVGTLYAYVENGIGHLAICTAVSGSTYTWQTLI